MFDFFELIRKLNQGFIFGTNSRIKINIIL
jgi:hypothetical protein